MCANSVRIPKPSQVFGQNMEQRAYQLRFEKSTHKLFLPVDRRIIFPYQNMRQIVACQVSPQCFNHFELTYWHQPNISRHVILKIILLVYQIDIVCAKNKKTILVISRDIFLKSFLFSDCKVRFMCLFLEQSNFKKKDGK